MDNKVIGNNFEKEFAEYLASKGFWVAPFIPKNYTGSQPCDLVAIKDDIAYLIDCKTCNTKYFPISRIEENQRQAYRKYKHCLNENFYLAIKYNNKIYKINMDEIDFTKKNIDLEELGELYKWK